jgi:transcriptional regulator with XRE-family HTH domain
MPMDSAALLVHCQIALGLSQKELGDLVGRDRRTIQRWQKGGSDLTPGQVQTLASALQPVRPDLAEQVLELGRKTGIVGPPASPATAEVIDAILQAAADAGGTSPEAIRPAVAAALMKAEEVGVEVGAIVAGLKANRTR